MAMALLCCGARLNASGQVPDAIFSYTNYVSSVNSVPGLTKNPDYAATTGRIAANSRGDVFFQSKNYSNADYVIEIPATGGSQVTLLTNLTGFSNPGVFADAEDNLWIPSQGGGAIIYDPFVNNTYAANVNANSLVKCTMPLAQNTGPCNFYWNLAPIGNFIQPSDAVLDGAGNLYVMDDKDGVTQGSRNRVLKISLADGTLTVAVDSLPESQGAQIAADPAGDIYYTDGSGVYYYPAASLPTMGGRAAGTSIGNGLSDPTGVALDAIGNLYICDTGNARIVEIPYLNGERNAQNQYTLITGPEIQSGSTTAYYGVAIDGYGNIYFVGINENSINHLGVGYLSLGASNIGATTGAQQFSLYFTAPETFGSFSVLGGSASASPFAVSTNACTAGQSYAAGDYCNVSITYKATAAGPQSGVLSALNASKQLLGEAALSGAGTGPGLNVDPGTIGAIGSGWTSPSAIAVDASGNTFVADSATGEIYRTAPGGSTPVVVANGFNTPTAVTVDGADNLYVGDSGNGQIAEVPLVSGAYGTPVVIATGLKGASGLAIDALGHLYVADSGNSRVLLLASAGGLPLGSLITPIGSGFTTPVAVAIDNAGNLYVSDVGSGDVVQIAIPTSQQLTILTGLKTAAGVAVDAGGSLYAADTGSGAIVRIPSIDGVLDKNFETTLATAVAKPVAIALDSAGNLYAADSADSTVAEMTRTAGFVSFGFVNVKLSSSAISAAVSDGGTAALVFDSPYFTAAGNTSSFSLQSSSTCASGATLQPGAACSVAAIFTPQTGGLLTDTLTFKSNAANSAAASLVFSGTGTALTKSTLTIAVTSPKGTPAYGQPVTVSATLLPQSGGIGTPTGTVTFFVDTVPQTPVPLASNAASITLTALTGGKHVLSASYSGNSNYASSASANLDIVIGTATTVTSDVTLASAQLWSDPVAVNPGTLVDLSVTIALPVPGTPTGTVTFLSGSTNLGSAPVLATAGEGGNGGGEATLATSTIPPGNYNITARYNGDTNFTASSSAAGVALLVSAPTIKMTASSNRITAGIPVTLTFASIAGFGCSGCTSASDISLACSGLPIYATCSFSPAFAAPSPGQPQQIALNVLADQPPPEPPTPAGFGPNPLTGSQSGLTRLLGICLLLPGLLFGAAMRRAQGKAWFKALRWPMLLLVLLGAGVLGSGGCGKSAGTFETPNGNSTLTVTATITPSKATPNPPPAQTLQFTLTVN
jgi:sugar lactone lactonase YvrE